MGTIDVRPRLVRAWGRAARSSGDDVRTTRAKVRAAEADVGQARPSGLAVKGASDRYTDGTESAIGKVATALTGTGDKLVDTANIVVSTDDESVDYFGPVRTPWANKPRWYGVGP